jgi:hypothetical protein
MIALITIQYKSYLKETAGGLVEKLNIKYGLHNFLFVRFEIRDQRRVELVPEVD